jgi:hypothetical protein
MARAANPARRPQLTFGKLALRLGVVSLDEVEQARAERRRQGGTLERILLAQGALTRELAIRVREVYRLACGACDRCGWRTDLEVASVLTCACGGAFRPLAIDDESGMDSVEAPLRASA